MAEMVGSKEASEIIGIIPRAVRFLCERGTLKAQKLGRDWVIDKQSVLDYKAKKDSQQPSTKGG